MYKIVIAVAVGVGLLAAGVVVGVMVTSHSRPAQSVATNGDVAAPNDPMEAPPAIKPARPQMTVRSLAPTAPAPAPDVVAVPAPSPSQVQVAATAVAPLIPEPVAREALARVGLDPQANLLWSQAINDPNLPRRDRRNLIEDLNEAGFPNLQRPTVADLPLIEARIMLIEAMIPNAMDRTNLEAFKEAHKDLTHMRARLTEPQPDSRR